MSDFIYTVFPFVKKCRFKEAVRHIMDILSTTLGGWVLLNKGHSYAWKWSIIGESILIFEIAYLVFGSSLNTT